MYTQNSNTTKLIIITYIIIWVTPIILQCIDIKLLTIMLFASITIFHSFLFFMYVKNKLFYQEDNYHYTDDYHNYMEHDHTTINNTLQKG